MSERIQTQKVTCRKQLDYPEKRTPAQVPQAHFVVAAERLATFEARMQQDAENLRKAGSGAIPRTNPIPEDQKRRRLVARRKVQGYMK